MSISKKITIHDIFSQKKENRIYRDILLWHQSRIRSLLENESYMRSLLENEYKTVEFPTFRLTEIGNWLLDVHEPFKNDVENKHVRKSYRVHSKRTYIQKRLDDLENLRLIEKTKIKSLKNQTDTFEYNLTQKGELVCSIIYLRNEKNVVLSNVFLSTFLEDLADMLDTFVFSTHKLLSSYLKDLLQNIEKKIDDKENKEKIKLEFIKKRKIVLESINLFYDFIPFIIDYWNNGEISRINKILISIISNYQNSLIYDIFFHTLHNLNQKEKKLILFQIKLEIESSFNSVSFDISNCFKNQPILDESEYRLSSNNIGEEWEKTRYENIQKFDKVCLCGFCKNCKKEYVLLMDIFEFLIFPDIFRVFKRKNGLIEGNLGYITRCVKCENNSFEIIPMWLGWYPLEIEMYYEDTT